MSETLSSPELNVDTCRTQCREMIRVGSRSFAMASMLFTSKKRDAAFFIYGWCRFCDDQIDQAKDENFALQALNELTLRTRSAFQGEKQSKAVFFAFQHVTKTHQIPELYAQDLLLGMQMDVQHFHYESFEDLLLYCYRVAGTVGLMMTHVMGITDLRALKNAVDLGKAMQLTNIARDVQEDFKMGRVYLPESWLREKGIPRAELLSEKYRKDTYALVLRLLEHAETFYQSGNSGLSYLPFRSAVAVSVASCIYREIGRKLRRLGPQALEQRTIIPTFRKLLLVLKGFTLALKTLPGRVLAPALPVPITTLWRHS